jgi:hypothetical protein
MWLTIWLAGAVLVTMGSDDMTAEFCEEQLKPMVVADIETGLNQDPDGTLWVEGENGERLVFQEWEVTCENKQLELGYKK